MDFFAAYRKKKKHIKFVFGVDIEIQIAQKLAWIFNHFYPITAWQHMDWFYCWFLEGRDHQKIVKNKWFLNILIGISTSKCEFCWLIFTIALTILGNVEIFGNYSFRLIRQKYSRFLLKNVKKFTFKMNQNYQILAWWIIFLVYFCRLSQRNRDKICHLIWNSPNPQIELSFTLQKPNFYTKRIFSVYKDIENAKNGFLRGVNEKTKNAQNLFFAWILKQK